MARRRWFERLILPLIDAPVTQPPDTLLAFYRHFLVPVRGTILIVLLISLVTAVTEMSIFVFLGWIVDRANEGPKATFFATYWPELAGMAAVIVLLRPINAILSRAFGQMGLMPALTFSVRWQSYRYVLRQSLAFFQNDFAGRIAQKVLQTGPSLRDTVNGLIDGIWTLLIYVGGTLWLFLGIDAWLIAPIALWSVGYVLVIVYLIPPVRARSAAVAEANSGLSGRIVDGYSNIQSVKLFAHAEREDAFAYEGFRTHLDAYRRFAETVANLQITLTVINSLLIFGVGAVSLWLWQSGTITVGSIALATSLVIRLNQMSGMIIRTITSLFESVGTVQNGMQTISRPYGIVDRPDATPLKVSKGDIRFEDVSFHYGRPGGVIDHLSLTVKPGERVGLVGRSGAGKSTLVNLLLRFYDVEGGRIVIDGQDVADVTQESLRAEIGVVTQDTSLLHRSIRDNIRYGKPEAGDGEIAAAAMRAEADEFIRTLRDMNGRTGYDAHVGERGVKLSGGQRQRVAIARLILKDAPILILDEATSALDSEVEATIQEQLYGLMKDRTVIAIAHRLSTIAVLDRLVVMDKGKIVETGTHAELLRLGGLYAQLWHRQSGGFLGLEEPGEAAAAE
ncbi:MAG TPA: ABC transporter ATP-binding protein [Bauldia sp.]|nr:ABC transporter ATP-binding protein [Bauldia sp.]